MAGAVIRTLNEKYGIKREELFLSSRQGFIWHDAVDDVPPELIIEELT